MVFEAKHTDSDKIDQSRLTPEQVESLTLHHKLGSCCLHHGERRAGKLLPGTVGSMARHEADLRAQHMKLEDLEPYRVQYIAGILKLLEGVEIDYTEEGGTP